MTDLKAQAALHNTRERITIAADQLQELAAEQECSRCCTSSFERAI